MVRTTIQNGQSTIAEAVRYYGYKLAEEKLINMNLSLIALLVIYCLGIEMNCVIQVMNIC